MLTAQQSDFWGRTYVISLDGVELTQFNPKQWGAGGTFHLDGTPYELTSNMWGATYALTTTGDKVIATAEKVGRKHWTVESEGRVYQFERISMWRGDQALMASGQQVGTLRRAKGWKLGVAAELPTLPVPVRVFVVAVVLTMWRAQAAAAAAG